MYQILSRYLYGVGVGLGEATGSIGETGGATSSGNSKGGVITGSSHDFSAATWNNDTSGEICNACHTPHSATVIADAPLWDRVTVINAGVTYDDYSSLTFVSPVPASYKSVSAYRAS